MTQRVAYAGHDDVDGDLQLELFVVENGETSLSLEFSRKGESLGVTVPQRLAAGATSVASKIQGKGTGPVVTVRILGGTLGKREKVKVAFDVEPATVPGVPRSGSAKLKRTAVQEQPKTAHRPAPNKAKVLS